MDPLTKAKIGVGMVAYLVILPLLALSGPVYYYFKVKPVLDDFNRKCGTDYNIIDVMLAGDRINTMCFSGRTTKDHE
jgi:hypothetical protein